MLLAIAICFLFIVAIAFAFPYPATKKTGKGLGIDRAYNGPPAGVAIVYAAGMFPPPEGGPDIAGGRFTFTFTESVIVDGPAQLFLRNPVTSLLTRQQTSRMTFGLTGSTEVEQTANVLVQTYFPAPAAGTYIMAAAPSTVRTRLGGAITQASAVVP